MDAVGYVGLCKCVSDMGACCWAMLEGGESCGTEGKLGEGWVHGGREWDHGPISQSDTLGSWIPSGGKYWRYLSA
jgi:hypothetical protein